MPIPKAPLRYPNANQGFNDKVARFPAGQGVHNNMGQWPQGQQQQQRPTQPLPQPQAPQQNQQPPQQPQRAPMPWEYQEGGQSGSKWEWAGPQTPQPQVPPVNDPGFNGNMKVPDQVMQGLNGQGGQLPPAQGLQQQAGALNGQQNQSPQGLGGNAGRIPRAPQPQAPQAPAQGYNQIYKQDIRQGDRLKIADRQRFEEMRKANPDQANTFRDSMLNIAKTNAPKRRK